MDQDLRNRFLEGMSRAATFVAVATTDGPGGRCGVTISSLTSVSADGDHPSMLACSHHLSPAATAILKNRSFCANLLHEGQQFLADLFAGRGGTDQAARFDRAQWDSGPLGQPRLAGATAVEIALQIGFGQFQTGWAAVNDSAERRAMAFAKTGQSE